MLLLLQEDALTTWNGKQHSCAISLMRDVFGHKWNGCIFFHLYRSNMGFKELERAVGQGVSQKVLTQRLKQLKRDGFIHRQVLLTTPLQVEYSITPLGVEAHFLLQNILNWYLQHLQPITGITGPGCPFKR